MAEAKQINKRPPPLTGIAAKPARTFASQADIDPLAGIRLNQGRIGGTKC